MKKQVVTIEIASGLEARPVAMLVQVASQYDSEIYIMRDNKNCLLYTSSGLSDSLCTFRTACFSAATQTTAIETGQKRQNLSDESLGLVVIGTHMKSSFY